MSRQLTAAEQEDLTPGEIAAIMGDNTEAAAAAALAEETAATDAAARAAEAANDKPEVDDDGEAVVKPEPTAEEIAAAAAVTEAAAKPDGEKKTEAPSKDDLSALLEEEDAPAPAAPKPVTYKGITEADYKAETAKLNAEKAAAMKQLMDGEIDADAYATIEATVAEKRDDLVANRTLARANQEALEQSNAQKKADFQTAIGALMKASVQPGALVNYAGDPKAQAQFDTASRVIAEDPDNAGLTPQQVCDKAHAMVLALRGIVPNAPAQAPAAAPPAAAKVPATKANPPPTTLSGLPAAAPNATGNDLRSQFALLEGEEAEEFLERLPAATRRALSAGAAV